MTGHQGLIHDMVLIADGKRLATVSSDEKVNIWDIKTGQEITSLPGHTGTVRSIAVLPDLDQIISASADETLVVRRVFDDIWSLRDHVCGSLASKDLVAGGYTKSPKQLREFCPPPRSR